MRHVLRSFFFKKISCCSETSHGHFLVIDFIIRLTEAILYRRAYRPCIFPWNLEKGVRGIGCSIIGNAYSWGFFLFLFLFYSFLLFFCFYFFLYFFICFTFFNSFLLFLIHFYLFFIHFYLFFIHFTFFNSFLPKLSCTVEHIGHAYSPETWRKGYGA